MTPSQLYIIDGFLMLYTVMLAHSRDVKTHQAVLIGLAGFLLAMTPAGYPVWWTFASIGSALLS